MRNVICRVRHEETGQTKVGWVKWTHAMVGQIVGSVEVNGLGHLAGPWIVEEAGLDAKELYQKIS